MHGLHWHRESAVKHGLAPKRTGGCVILRATSMEDGTLQLECEDDGVGFPLAISTRGSGTALENTRTRVRLIYGPAAGLTLETPAGGGTRVRLRLPQDPRTAFVTPLQNASRTFLARLST